MNHGLRSKGQSVSNFEIKALHMTWRDSSNTTNSVVYLMRHMETYMGESADRWQCGLRKGWKKKLSYLRSKYARRMIISNSNVLHSDIKSSATSHFKNITKNGAFDIDRAMFNTDYSI